MRKKKSGSGGLASNGLAELINILRQNKMVKAKREGMEMGGKRFTSENYTEEE